MKQVTANYQFELSEKELTTLCTALSVVIKQLKEDYDSLKNKLEKENVDQEEGIESTKQLLRLKDELLPLLDFYNTFGSPIGKRCGMSFI